MAIPIGLQLYSVRDDVARDLPDVLRQVAAMGYAGVEFYGDYDMGTGSGEGAKMGGYAGQNVSAIRTMLNDLGLVCCGAHVPLHRLQGSELAHSIEFHKTLGNTRLIVPGLSKEYSESHDAWLRTAETFNGIAAGLADEGMQTGYHNHSSEFKPFADTGAMPWDIFFGNTDASVIMQFDTGNALHGGAQTRPFIERYPGRARSVHLKEYSATDNGAVIGEGTVPFDEIFDVCETIGGVEWYVVEQEGYNCPPLESAKQCLENLRKMGK